MVSCHPPPKMIQYFCTYMHLFGDIAALVLAHRGGFYYLDFINEITANITHIRHHAAQMYRSP